MDLEEKIAYIRRTMSDKVSSERLEEIIERTRAQAKANEEELNSAPIE